MALNGIKNNKCFAATYQPVRGTYVFPAIAAGASAVLNINLANLDLPSDSSPVISTTHQLQLGETYNPDIVIYSYIDTINGNAVIVCENNTSGTIDTMLVNYLIL